MEGFNGEAEDEVPIVMERFKCSQDDPIWTDICYVSLLVYQSIPDESPGSWFLTEPEVSNAYSYRTWVRECVTVRTNHLLCL